MPTAKSLLGKRAEDLAVAELKRRGYQVIETNYRCRWGEIDIIAKDGETTAFIEVRSRRSNETTYPAESINKKKQTKLILTAQQFLTEHNLGSDCDCRFDVVEVRFERGKSVSVKVIQDAFGENSQR